MTFHVNAPVKEHLRIFCWTADGPLCVMALSIVSIGLTYVALPSKYKYLTMGFTRLHIPWSPGALPSGSKRS
jgi:hypothetical protein